MIRGVFLSFILTIAGIASLIIIIPWLWNWIVFIWNSPLSAGEATRIYLWESILECIPFVGGGLISLFLLDLLINGDKYKYKEINVFENASPTPSSNTQNYSSTAPLEQKSVTASEVGQGKKLVEMWVDDPNGTGGTKETVERYSPRWKELVALQAREYDHKPFIKKSNKEIFMGVE